MPDNDLQSVVTAFREMDPKGIRTAKVLRDTLDQLYDGRRTGRYRWDQLFKTEKTHCGTLVEINLQREFRFTDGKILDFLIAGVETDCKYSQSLGGWMIPQEARNQICMLVWASDDAKPTWSLGMVRASEQCLRSGLNRDMKSSLNDLGRNSICWIFRDELLPPNVLLQLDPMIVEQIMSLDSGQKRLNELFRRSLQMLVGRAVVATVAQQDDYMKRLRENGGSRSTLRDEGILILGQYSSHAAVAHALGLAEPNNGESMSIRVYPASPSDAPQVVIEGSAWRIATSYDPIVPAPKLPSIHRS